MSRVRYSHTINEEAFLRKTTHAQLIERVPDGSTVLEVGCSTGYISHYLHDVKRCIVTGIEIDPEAAGLARAFCRQVIIGDIETDRVMEQLNGRLFDVILLGDVLEHLVNPDRTLIRLKRFLSPHGRVLISVPNVANWRLRLSLALGKFQYTKEGLLDETHLRFFTLKTLRAIIMNTGYTIESISYWAGGGRPLPMLLTRFFPGLLAFQFIVSCRPALQDASPVVPTRGDGTLCRYDCAMVENPKTTHAQILKLVGHHKRVLEAGCSTGRLSKYLMEQGCSVVGVEVEEAAAREARKYCKEVIVGNIESPAVLGRISGAYDVILFGDVLEHLKRPERVLKDVRQFLDPNGYVIITLPNIANFKVRFEVLMGRFQYRETGILDRSHVRFYTFSSAIQMIRESGYAIDYFHVAGMNMPMFLMKLNPKFFAPQFVFKVRSADANS